MSRTISEDWIQKAIESIIATDNSNFIFRRSPKVCIVVDVDKNNNLITLSDTKCTIKAFLTDDCIRGLSSQLQDENYDIAKLKHCIVKLNNYHFSTVLQCCGGRRFPAAISGLNIGFDKLSSALSQYAIQICELSYLSNDYRSHSYGDDVNRDSEILKLSESLRTYKKIVEKLLKSQFPNEAYLPNLNCRFYIDDPFSDSNSLLPEYLLDIVINTHENRDENVADSNQVIVTNDVNEVQERQDGHINLTSTQVDGDVENDLYMFSNTQQNTYVDHDDIEKMLAQVSVTANSATTSRTPVSILPAVHINNSGKNDTLVAANIDNTIDSDEGGIDMLYTQLPSITEEVNEEINRLMEHYQQAGESHSSSSSSSLPAAISSVSTRTKSKNKAKNVQTQQESSQSQSQSSQSQSQGQSQSQPDVTISQHTSRERENSQLFGTRQEYFKQIQQNIITDSEEESLLALYNEQDQDQNRGETERLVDSSSSNHDNNDNEQEAEEEEEEEEEEEGIIPNNLNIATSSSSSSSSSASRRSNFQMLKSTTAASSSSSSSSSTTMKRNLVALQLENLVSHDHRPSSSSSSSQQKRVRSEVHHHIDQARPQQLITIPEEIYANQHPFLLLNNSAADEGNIERLPENVHVTSYYDGCDRNYNPLAPCECFICLFIHPSG